MRYPVRLITTRSRKKIEDHLKAACVDDEGIRIITQKTDILIIKVSNVPAAAANIIKQQLLSLGGDAAVHRDVITGSPDSSDVYVVSDRRHLSALAGKLESQPFKLSKLGRDIESLLETRDNPPRTISLAEGELDLSDTPLIMGVLNVTPDSFSDGDLYTDPGRAVDRALEMAADGAAIIDLGGESSRPGARDCSIEEELARITPVLQRLSGKLKVPLSIDTRKKEVARAAIDAGAVIINDISGLRQDPGMVSTAVEAGAAVIIMHMQGRPETMQINPSYEDPVTEIIEWLDGRTKELISNGLEAGKIIIDPGIGFGKRLNDNLCIIDEIGDFHVLGLPVCVGYSRKSFIGAITGTDTGGRLHGGLAVLGRCIEAGVQIVRVHDVRETADFIKVWKAVKKEENDI
jgi:dihydropteroate synthase